MISIARASARIVGGVVRLAGAGQADDQPHAAEHVFFLALHAADVSQHRAGRGTRRRRRAAIAAARAARMMESVSHVMSRSLGSVTVGVGATSGWIELPTRGSRLERLVLVVPLGEPAAGVAVADLAVFLLDDVEVDDRLAR